jgi:hypothetical protein
VITGTATARAPEGLAELPFVTFRRTVPRDEELVEFVRTQLKERTGAPPRLVFLSESGTVYGRAGNAQSSSTREEHFKFPLHISAIRTALEKQDKAGAASTPSLRRTLALKLDPEEESAPDAPQNYSDLTPYVEELSLGREFVRI